MDSILRGILQSNHPKNVKLALVTEISKASTRTVDENVVYSLYNICLEFLSPSYRVNHEETEADIRTALTCLFSEWIKNKADYFFIYFQRKFLEVKFGETHSSDCIQHIKDLGCCLKCYRQNSELNLYPSKGKLKEYLVSSFIQMNNFDLLYQMCDLYLNNIILIPIHIEQSMKLKVMEIFIDIISAQPFQFVPKELQRETENDIYYKLNVVIDLYTKFVSLDISLMKFVAERMFKIMCDPKQDCSVMLAKCLPSLRLDIINESLEEMVATGASEESLTNCLLHLIEYCCFPDPSLGIGDWVIQYMKCLLKYRKYAVLFDSVERKAKQVLNLINFADTRKSSVAVLTFMMMSYLHSPAPFHQLCPSFLLLLNTLKKEDNEDANQVHLVLVELLYTLMYHFTGYPDLYVDLVEYLKGYAKPSEENMKAWLSASFSLPKVDLKKSFSFTVTKSDTGKIGLENLGNTCYANSVIQALFNSPSFRKDVLKGKFQTQTHPVSSNLQKLFALLQLSERPVIAPKNFLEVSRPPWFQKGTQQDCSEFMKYLFDMLEQEKTKDEIFLTTSVFNGVMTTSTECLKCRNISTLKENFNDIPLSFNESDTSCTLKGGDSSDQIQRKMSITPDGTLKSSVSEINPPEAILPEATETSIPGSTIPTIKSLVELLNIYFLPEDLKDSNQYYCDKCAALQDAVKYHRIVDFPKYLVLTLKRFTYDITTQSRSKILQVLDYSSKFSFCDQCTNSGHMEEENEDFRNRVTVKKSKCDCLNSIEYRISAVIVHSGISSESGHYYCYSCQYNSTDRCEWLLMNDSRITRADQGSLKRLGETFQRDSPYICIYEKVQEGDYVNSLVPDMSQDLVDFVTNDNKQYFNEEVQKKVAEENRQRFSTFFRKDNHDDDHGGSGPSNICGGGVGNCWDSGRFIF